MPAQTPAAPRISFEVVSSDHALRAVVDEIAGHELIGVDTEFMRTSTYWAQLCLVQVAANGKAFVVDTLLQLDLAPLWQLFETLPSKKIVHAASQDLEIFYAAGRNRVAPCFDTQIAAGLVGLPAQAGYAKAVEELLGISVGKSQTRTDWSRRPLTDAQLEYAALDALYLPALYGVLGEALDRKGRLEWAVEDSARAADPGRFRVNDVDAWQRVKGMNGLNGAARASVVRLAQWREQAAIRMNRPRLWILTDAQLLAIAAAAPQTQSEIAAVDALPPGLVKRQADALAKVVRDAEKDYESGKLSPPKVRARDPARQDLIRDLRKKVGVRAKELGIAAEVLASRRDLEALLDGDETCRLSSGWRRELIAGELLALI